MLMKVLHKLLLIFLVIFLFFSCGEREVPKRVSLTKRASVNENLPKGVEYNSLKDNSLKFGFDLRLEPKEDVRIYLPFLQYLEEATGYKFAIRFTEKYEDTVENLGKGLIHFAALGPVNYVLAKKKYEVGCLVMGLNVYGKPEYRAAIITRIDSPIKDIKDLKGKTFAFGDKFSTQGHLIPRKMLEEAGISLKDLSMYVFTGSHANTARAVINGRYEAGGIQDQLALRLQAEGKIRILALSQPYPSSMICYSKKIEPSIVSSVRKALLTFNPKDPKFREWNKTEMPMGFTECREDLLKEIETLVERYGLFK